MLRHHQKDDLFAALNNSDHDIRGISPCSDSAVESLTLTHTAHRRTHPVASTGAGLGGGPKPPEIRGASVALPLVIAFQRRETLAKGRATGACHFSTNPSVACTESERRTTLKCAPTHYSN